VAVLRFYEDLCSFLLDLCVMADENDLANACKFIEGISWSFLYVANMVYHYDLCVYLTRCACLFLQIACILLRFEINLVALFLSIISAWMMNSFMRSKCALIWLVICSGITF